MPTRGGDRVGQVASGPGRRARPTLRSSRRAVALGRQQRPHEAGAVAGADLQLVPFDGLGHELGRHAPGRALALADQAAQRPAAGAGDAALQAQHAEARHVVAVDLAAGAEGRRHHLDGAVQVRGSRRPAGGWGPPAGPPRSGRSRSPGPALPAPTGACGAAASSISRRVRRLPGLGLGLRRRLLGRQGFLQRHREGEVAVGQHRDLPRRGDQLVPREGAHRVRARRSARAGRSGRCCRRA